MRVLFLHVPYPSSFRLRSLVGVAAAVALHLLDIRDGFLCLICVDSRVWNKVSDLCRVGGRKGDGLLCSVVLCCGSGLCSGFREVAARHSQLAAQNNEATTRCEATTRLCGTLLKGFEIFSMHFGVVHRLCVVAKSVVKSLMTALGVVATSQCHRNCFSGSLMVDFGITEGSYLWCQKYHLFLAVLSHFDIGLFVTWQHVDALL